MTSGKTLDNEQRENAKSTKNGTDVQNTVDSGETENKHTVQKRPEKPEPTQCQTEMITWLNQWIK